MCVATKKAAPQTSYYRAVGNAAHVACVVSTTAFAVLVGMFANDKNSSFFDSDWKANGFCVTNKTVPYWNSHDVCFYVDTVLALVFMALYWSLKQTPGMEYANKYAFPGIFGILAHGMGHGGVGQSIRDSNFDTTAAIEASELTLADRLRSDGFLQVGFQESVAFLFWIGLLYASMTESKKSAILAVSIPARIGQIYMPAHFAFTYVQTVLMLAFSINQFSVQTKEFAYMMYPIVVGLPVTAMGWIESKHCSRFVKDMFYGHVIYDGYIAVSMICWYLICYFRAFSRLKVKTL